MGLKWCYAISLRFVPVILNQDSASTARAHGLDRQIPEMEAGNLLLKPRKSISKAGGHVPLLPLLRPILQ
jgi:hypothetical protein